MVQGPKVLQSRLHATPRCCSRQPRGQKGHCRRRAFLKHRGVCGEERGQDLSDFVVPSPDEGADLVRGTAALKCSQCWACGLRDLEGKEEGAAEVMQGVRREGICQHNRQTSLCRECGGSSICQHNRQRSACEECEGEVCVCVQIRKGRLDAARSRGALFMIRTNSSAD